jgi:hypothetical protein
MKIITPVAKLSYPTLFEPKAYQGGTPKYSASLVFPAGTDLKALKAAVVKVAKEKWGDEGVEIVKRMRDPAFRPGENKGYGEGSFYIAAKTTNQPGIVTRHNDPKTGRPSPINEAMATEPDGANEMYPGVLVKAYVSVYASEGGGNKGVFFGLEGLQRWEDSERLDGRVPVTSVFDGEDLEEGSLEDVLSDDDTDGIDEIL